MFYKNTLLLFVFLLCSLSAFSDTFIVTSNADSGTGTLREALTKAAANDSTQTDYINFNLPDLSESGRTIILLTQLPDLSSNLVIDGSTQPGGVFGISNARVQLMYKTPIFRSLSGLRIVNHHDIALYGLYINLITNINPPSNAYFFLYNGIEIKNAINIIVGDVGKGNAVNGFPIPLTVNSPDTIHHTTPFSISKNLTIKNSFFGIGVDGETQSVNPAQQVSINFIVGQIILGGNSALEGNLFATGITISQQNNSDSTDPRDVAFSTPAKIDIRNNKIGVDFNTKKTLITATAISISCVTPNGKDTVDIIDNVIDSNNGYAIFPTNIGSKIRILRNYIGIDRSMQNVLPTGGIFLYWDFLVQIGSSDPADANYITNCAPVNIWPYTNATVNKNSFFCTKNAAPMHTLNDDFPFPAISILNITPSSVSGTATPNSMIELFYSDYCGTCSPQTYFASTTTDTNGNWKYNGAVTGAVIASATLDKNTSDFTRTSIDVKNLKIINACVNNGLGSITGVVPKSAPNIQWIDIDRKVVGTNPDLLNVPLGKYKLLAQNGGCSDSTSYFEIKAKYQLVTTNLKITNPSCNNSTGSIRGLQIQNNDPAPISVSWTDSNNKSWSQTVDATGLPVGNYTLNIISSDNLCNQTYGPITLTNTTGPNIDQSAPNIQGSNCGTSTGSITNVIGTGSGIISYIWKNAKQQQVATTKDLFNQPAGSYTLQVNDQSTCGAVVSSPIAIPELNGITLDESLVIKTAATCGNNNGSITGIKVKGATTYQWFDSSNNLISTNADLKSASPNIYHLVVSNATCSKQSANYTISNTPGFVNYASTKTTKDAACGLNNGSINVTFTGSVLPDALKWRNQAGQNIGSKQNIDNLDAGTYSLYVTDSNGCESFYQVYMINRILELGLDLTSQNQVNDNCTLQTGSISGINITGGLQPYNYKWMDDNNKILANTLNIDHLGAGTYTLAVKDATGCASVVYSVIITNQSSTIPSPSVSNIQLCGPGDAIISINNASSSYKYRLYNSPDAATPIAEQNSSQFKVSVKNNTTFYISQLSGSCESARVLVKVSLGLTAININNTFTPNGDGRNDLWNITGMENYPNAKVQVFNRNGQKVFESKGYPVPFDGRFNGQDLPTGVYYYIINLNTKCDIISGSLTIVR